MDRAEFILSNFDVMSCIQLVFDKEVSLHNTLTYNSIQSNYPSLIL